MRKKLAALSTAAILVTGPGEADPIESGQYYEAGIFMPGEDCRREIFDEMGHEALTLAMAHDSATFEEREEQYPIPTKSTNSAKVEPKDIKHLPKIEDYISDNLEFIAYFDLPKSGIQITLSSDTKWHIDAELLEETLINTFANVEEEPGLVNEVYKCQSRAIFELGALDHAHYKVYVFGEGGLCLARDRIEQRSEDDACTAAGRHRKRNGPNVIYITPRAGDNTEFYSSGSLIHELMHGFQDDMNMRHENASERETVAYDFQKRAKQVMQERALYPLQLKS